MDKPFLPAGWTTVPTIPSAILATKCLEWSNSTTGRLSEAPRAAAQDIQCHLLRFIKYHSYLQDLPSLGQSHPLYL